MVHDADARGAGDQNQPAWSEPGVQGAGDAALPPTDAALDAAGESCATLTPLIRARMRELTSGQILVVSADDPAAREGVPSWSRLTGNELLATVEDGAATRFYLRKR